VAGRARRRCGDPPRGRGGGGAGNHRGEGVAAVWGTAAGKGRRWCWRGGGEGAAAVGRGGGVREESVSESERARRGCGGYISLLCRVPRSGTRQRFFFNLKHTLPSVLDLALGKDGFAECQLTNTRRRQPKTI
jgi:hypothetical protein